MATTSTASAVETDRPLHESFENSVGPLTEHWGVDFSTFGEARFAGNQYSTAGMKEPGAVPSAGHGYGTYTVNAKFTGNTAGSAIMLWPGDNKYPGQEIDLAETAPDGSGRQYAAIHWNDNGQNRHETQFLEGVQGGVFHECQVVWEPGKLTFNVDGRQAAVFTNHVPVDYDNGGMNNTIAFLNNNDATTLTVRDVTYVPLGGPAPVSSAPAPDGPPVYRFYDTEHGGHLYTSNIGERDGLISNASTFRYEGVGFKALDPGAAGVVPVFRFYNSADGGHFFTTSTEERDTVMARLPSYHYEGVGFYEANAAGKGLAPVFRYYNPANGDHLFTASAAEKASVDAHNPDYRFEGIAFYTPTAGLDAIFLA